MTARDKKRGKKNWCVALYLAVTRDGIPVKHIDEHLFAKEFVLGDGAKRQRLVLVKNTQEQKRAEETRRQLIQTNVKKDFHAGFKSVISNFPKA